MKHLPYLRIFCLLIIVFLVLASASLAANTGLAQKQLDPPLPQMAEMDQLEESPQTLDQEIILSAAGYEGIPYGSSDQYIPFISENKRNTTLFISFICLHIKQGLEVILAYQDCIYLNFF